MTYGHLARPLLVQSLWLLVSSLGTDIRSLADIQGVLWSTWCAVPTGMSSRKTSEDWCANNSGIGLPLGD